MGFYMLKGVVSVINKSFEHIKNICKEKFWLNENGQLIEKNPLIDDLMNSIERLSEGLYSKDTHFIFELIQNAEDNTYNEANPSISFNLVKKDPTNTKNSAGALIIQNNEIGFSPANVDAICAVGKTTKSKIDGYIGEKGIGFKSVFRVTTTPYIFSGGYQFCLPEKYKETGLGFIVPQWIENLPQEINLQNTVIILPLDKPDFGYEKIEDMLRDIEPETILFLSKLKEIQIKTDLGDHFTILKDDTKNPQIKILIEGEKKGVPYTTLSKFLLYGKSVDRPKNVIHEKRIGIDKRDISIAFPLGGNKESQGKVFAYLPIRSDTGLPFLINADFILTSSREQISEKVPWNEWLMKSVAHLLTDSLSGLRDKNLLTINFLEELAKRMTELGGDEKSMFYPVFVAISKAFLEQELLPTDEEGQFVSAKNSKLARGSELRELIPSNDLRAIFHVEHDLKWLSGDITQDNTPNLRTFLMSEHLKVDEIRAVKLIQLITDDFLETRTDDWFVQFYNFLGKDKLKLWEKDNSILRQRKILRLEDNSNVIPFRSDGRPNAYLPSLLKTNFPIIKRTISIDKGAEDFLRDLGLVESDLFAEVIEFVLPKYTNDLVCPVSFQENVEDLRKIRKLMTDSSQIKGKDLIGKLKILALKLKMESMLENFDNLLEILEPTELIQTLMKFMFDSIEFIYAINYENNKKYKTAKDIYLHSNELWEYFKGGSTIWFVDECYPVDLEPLFKELSIESTPRVQRPNVKVNGYIVIKKYHGLHKRALDGFDPDIEVEGLANALKHPTVEKSLFIWDRIVIENVDCIRGVVESSTKKTYENSDKNEQLSKNFGQLLVDNLWLLDNQGNFFKPSELMLTDLPDEFESTSIAAREVAEKLGMRQPEREQALEVITEGDNDFKMLIEHYQAASDDERKKILKTIPREIPPIPAPPFKDGLKNLGRTQRGKIDLEDKEMSQVYNPDRYQDKLSERVERSVEEHQSTPRKITFSPLRDHPSNKEARRFLYEQYHGRCQVTEMTFPKANRNNDGMAENYFEACGLLSYVDADYLNDAGNMLCVSADTMVKFKYASFEFMESLEDAIETFSANGESAECVAVKIRLAGEECYINWGQRHFMRLVALYEKA